MGHLVDLLFWQQITRLFFEEEPWTTKANGKETSTR